MANKVSIGTISHSTLRLEDLIPAFLGELADLDPQAVIKIRADFPEYAEAEDDEDADFWSEETPNWMLEALNDALNEHAPDYCYFGSTEGDGSDFGFWPMMEAVEDDIAAGQCRKVADLGELPDDYVGNVLQVSDHGNATLYYADNGKFVEAWSIV